MQEHNPLVSVVMGSDSDLPTLEPAVSLLGRFQVETEVRVLSAHRTPLEMISFAQNSLARGVKVIVAGAGGAAHLPGMLAALTPLPVIGVPVVTKALSGLDSMYSIVQMPGGVPVATVAIGGGLNAGLLAVQILAIGDNELQMQLIEYKKKMHDEVVAKDLRLVQQGITKYLANNK